MEDQQIKIALFGFYSFRNFGDDHVAVVFDRILAERGIEVRVLGPRSGYADLLEGERVDDCSSLLAGADMALFGGGGVFVPTFKTPLRYGEFGRQVEEFIALCRAGDIPIHAISVGSSGSAGLPLTPPFRQALFEAVDSFTVRNPEDLHLLEEGGKEGEYHPDILWLTPSFFPGERHGDGPFTVAVNLQNPRRRLRAALRRLILSLVTALNRTTRFIFIDTDIGAAGAPHAFRPFRMCRNHASYTFSNWEDDLAQILQCDLVVSNKLHLGLVAMSYGIPFLSFRGQEKTRTLLANLGREDGYFTRRDLWRLYLLLLSPRRLAAAARNIDVGKIEQMQSAAEGHLAALDRILRRAAAPGDQPEARESRRR